MDRFRGIEETQKLFRIFLMRDLEVTDKIRMSEFQKAGNDCHSLTNRQFRPR